MLFFAGVCQLLLTVAWWSMELSARYIGLSPSLRYTVAPTWAHLYLMLFTVFPFFIFGFLFTVYPRWLGTPPVERVRYLSVFLLLSAGALLFYAGLFTHKVILVASLVVAMAGWGVALSTLLHVTRQARTRDAQTWLLNATVLAGLIALAAYLLGLVTGSARFILFAGTVGLWLFLVPVVFSVAYRMIPFFSAAVLVNYEAVRPRWSLRLILVFAAGHAALQFLGWIQWRFVFDVPLLLMALYHTVRWQFRRSFEVRLVAMLHIAFLWLTIALALYSVQSLVFLFTGILTLGLAPLHALTVGFMAGMVVAMVSRVTLGHSGRSLVADNLTWYAFLGVSLAAVARVAAGLPLGSGGAMLNLVAALLWLTALGSWVWHYAPIYWRPRVDGKPG